MLINQGRRRQRLAPSIGICIILLVLTLLSFATPGTARAANSATATTTTPNPTSPPIVRPVVSITSPGQEAVLTLPAPIQIKVQASISSGHITRVEFQAIPDSGTNPLISIGTDTSAPYSINWKNAPTGVYVLNVTAYSDGPYATSTSERIAVTTDGRDPFPKVNIISPSDGAQFVSPATIQIQASATVGSGNITKVDFQAQSPGLTYQSTATSAPYNVTFSNVYPGTYTVYAVAYANTSVGVVGSTSTIQITVKSGPSLGGCGIKYTVTQFTGGFLASISIINASDTTINGWKLVFTFPGSQQLLYGWNGIFAQTGNQVTVSNVSWNSSIAPNGGVINIGFNGSWSGSNPSPTDFALNGVSCRVI